MVKFVAHFTHDQVRVKKEDMTEREATQAFTIYNILCGHAGEKLTHMNVERIKEEIVKEMREGFTAWAFKPEGEKA